VTAKTALMHMHRAVKMTSVNENVAFILTLFIAQSLVSVPAASTASDRAFSLAGHTMEEEMSATSRQCRWTAVCSQTETLSSGNI